MIDPVADASPTARRCSRALGCSPRFDVFGTGEQRGNRIADLAFEEYTMLAVTDNAATVIRDLTDQEGMPEGTGLRIAADESAGAFRLSLSPAPQEGDQVLDAEGARLFLDHEAAQMLDDKALDAAVDAQGGVQFAVGEQPNSE
jgi:iron-sulfur cluster assembly protein